MTLPLPAIILLVVNLGLLWLLLAAPIGRRTIRRDLRLKGDASAIFALLKPDGFAQWNPSVLRSETVGGKGDQTEVYFKQPDRYGKPITRTFQSALEQNTAGPDLTVDMEIVADSALDQSFWKNFHERRSVRAVPGGAAVTIEQTDRYRGLAFYLYRYFQLGREASALQAHVEHLPRRTNGLLEHPGMQIILALLSTLILWPFFGLNREGLAMSTMLTMVIVLHEFGHMAAYRAFGHQTVRMIFVPLLGGIAIGGRPYNSQFEVATCALMGPGMSAFFVPILAVLGQSAHAGLAPTATEAPAMAMLLILGAFNLLNLLPMQRFDGGQVLRQIFQSRKALAVTSFGIALAILWTGWRIGVPTSALLAALAVFILMSLMGAIGAKPRHALDEMTGAERLLTGFGLYAAVLIHAYAVVTACDSLFG